MIFKRYSNYFLFPFEKPSAKIFPLHSCKLIQSFWKKISTLRVVFFSKKACNSPPRTNTGAYGFSNVIFCIKWWKTWINITYILNFTYLNFSQSITFWLADHPFFDLSQKKTSIFYQFFDAIQWILAKNYHNSLSIWYVWLICQVNYFIFVTIN